MEKSSAITVLFFLMFAPITFQCVESETFFIVVTSESPCFESGSNESSLGSGQNPGNNDIFQIDEDSEPECLTLQQFVTRFSNNSYQNLTNITLELDSGEHSLNSTLSVFNVTSFTMKSDAVATIICSQPGVRLQLHNIEDIVISGTTFIGCEEIKVSFVDQFRFENSSFQSSPNGSLTLNHTMNATIIGSSFFELRHSDYHRAAITINNSSVLIQYCTFSNNAVCLYSTLSEITIDTCTFVNNLVIGGDRDHRTAMISTVNGPQTNKIMTITNCDFINNYCKVLIITDDYHYPRDGRNSILFIDGSEIVLNNSRIVNNTGFNEVLYIDTEYSLIIMDSNSIYNNKVYDAAVYIDVTNISIAISYSNFTVNNATALILPVSYGTVAISDSNFIGNRKSEIYPNGAIAVGPAQLYYKYDCSFNASVVIIGCSFVSNYLPGETIKSKYYFKGAVGIYTDTGSVSIKQSTFIDNLSTYYENSAAALAIDTHSSVLIDSCTFIENKALENGAVYIQHASSVFITHTNFLNNQGSDTYSGSVMTLIVDNAVIVVNESYFYGNLNTRNFNWTDGFFFYHHEGAIDLVGKNNSLIIDKSSFINNPISVITAWFSGDGDTPTGSIAILRSNFTNNTDQYKGMFLSANTVEINETTFLNNSANSFCGVLSMQAHDIHITNSHFVRNSAVYYSGGAICTYEKFNRMSILNSTFSHNYARYSGAVLIMIMFVNVPVNGTVHIRGCTFANNRADSEGGVFWAVPLRAFYISDSLFIKNQAGRDGGVVMMSDYHKMNSQLIVSGSSFDQNEASRRGGVFSSFVPCKYVVDNSSFTGNQAGTDGGVMYVGSGNSQVRISDGSTFSFNDASNRGGVISINGSKLEITNTTVFNDNFAGIGDDIFACNCNVISAPFVLQSYADPSFPNCNLYGHYEITTADSLPTKPTGYVVAMAVSVPIAFIVILLLLTAILLGAYMCCRRQRCLVKQYGVRRSDHPDFVPLMNNT